MFNNKMTTVIVLLIVNKRVSDFEVTRDCYKSGSLFVTKLNQLHTNFIPVPSLLPVVCS